MRDFVLYMQGIGKKYMSFAMPLVLCRIVM